MDWLQIQTRLKELGFDPGPLDGEYGPLTAAGVRAFQLAWGVVVKWPGTVGPKTLAALFDNSAKPVSPAVKYPWLDVAVSKMGLQERRDNKELREFLKSDGRTLGDPAVLPWCGDFMETCMLRSVPNDPVPSNPYLARNWQKYGQPIEATVGAIGVFWRGSKSGTSGHVAFLLGQNGVNFIVLGGNQNDSISVTSIAKSRLLEARWPKTWDLPTTLRLPVATAGAVSWDEL